MITMSTGDGDDNDAGGEKFGLFSHGPTHIDSFVPQRFNFNETFSFFYVQAVYSRHFEWKWT